MTIHTPRQRSRKYGVWWANLWAMTPCVRPFMGILYAATSRHRRISILAAFLGLLCPAHAHAQPITANQPDTLLAPTTDPLTEETLKEDGARLEALASDPDTKQLVTSSIATALERVIHAQESRAAATTFAQEIAKVPGLLDQLNAELRQPVAEVTIDQNPTLTLDEVSTQLKAAQAERAAAQTAQDKLRTDLANLNPDQLNITLPTLRNDLEEARAARNAELDTALAEPARLAIRLTQQAEVEKLQAEIAKAERNLELINLNKQLLPKQIEKSQRRVDRAAKAVQLWEAYETKKRQDDAAAAAADAGKQAQQAQDQPEPIKQIVTTNDRLAKTRESIAGENGQLQQVKDRLDTSKADFKVLEDRIRNTLDRVEVAELSTAIGLYLRSELNSLPNSADLRAERNRLSAQISDAQYALIELQELESQYASDSAVQDVIDASLDSTTVSEEELRFTASNAIDSLIENIDKLRTSSNDLISTLLDLNGQLDTIARATTRYRTFIEERILWIRSVKGSLVPKPADMFRATAWMFDPSTWIDGLGQHWKYRQPHRIAEYSVAIVVLLLLALIPSMHRLLYALAPLVSRFATDRFRFSIAALSLTLGIALAVSLPVLLLGYWISLAAEQVLAATGHGLMTVSVFLFVVVFVRTAVLPKGLLSSHFRWSTDGLLLVQRTTTLAALIGLPLLFIATTLGAQSNPQHTNSMGRVAFIAMSIVLAIANAHIFRPTGTFVGPYISKKTDTLVTRLHKLWYTVIVGMPIMLGVLASLGWYYTASKLDMRVHLTIWTIIAVIVVNGMLLRWLFIERRRLALDRARKKREAEKSDESTTAGAIEETQIDIPEIDAQTRRVIRAGVTLGAVLALFAIWADVLPALRMLDRVQLLPRVAFLEAQQHTASIELLGIVGESDVAVTPTQPTETTPAPTTTGDPTRTSENDHSNTISPQSFLRDTATADPNEPTAQPTRFTLMDALAAIIVLGISFVLARNVPGLLEILVLKKLPLDSGSRFAVSTIVRYLIAMIGVIIAFNVVGLRWSQLQFLAAAVTFGLAFGLQEIFANFISGLIMLVERPVRVGDTVTVGGVSGDVTRINIRATTVRDWDRKELVIPNKTFVTDQFVNWTLSDRTQRLIIPVGVSYDSNIDAVTTTLLSIARSREYVMTDPSPSVVFQRFGDSTLDFELRVYLRTIDQYLEAKTDLHRAVISEFRRQGIEIAFPQQDLHIRSVVPFAIEKDRSGSE